MDVLRPTCTKRGIFPWLHDRRSLCGCLCRLCRALAPLHGRESYGYIHSPIHLEILSEGLTSVSLSFSPQILSCPLVKVSTPFLLPKTAWQNLERSLHASLQAKQNYFLKLSSQGPSHLTYCRPGVVWGSGHFGLSSVWDEILPCTGAQ